MTHFGRPTRRSIVSIWSEIASGSTTRHPFRAREGAALTDEASFELTLSVS
jgi:hypothetical protein